YTQHLTHTQPPFRLCLKGRGRCGIVALLLLLRVVVFMCVCMGCGALVCFGALSLLFARRWTVCGSMCVCVWCVAFVCVCVLSLRFARRCAVCVCVCVCVCGE